EVVFTRGAHAPRSPDERGGPAMTPTHIVVVEDEPAIRRGLADLLQASGHKVSEAGDGATGLTVAGGPRVDPGPLAPLLPAPAPGPGRRAGRRRPGPGGWPPSSPSRPGAARTTGSAGCAWAPTTTSSSRSPPASCSPASRPSSAGPAGGPGRPAPPGWATPS